MKLQAEPSEGLSHTLLGLLARRLRVAHDHKVVRVPHQHAQMGILARPHGVEHVQEDVRQQRRNHSALRRSRARRGAAPVFHHPCLKPLPQQSEHPPVRLQQLVVVDASEIVANVSVEHLVASMSAPLPQGLQGLRRAPLRPKAVRARMKVRLENRLQHERCRHLRHSVSDRRNAQWPSLPVALRNIPTPHRRGSVCARLQSRAKVFEKSLDTPLLDRGQRHRIDARRAAVPLDPSPCFPQDVTPVDAVQQRMKTAARLPLGRTPQSTLQLAHFVEGLASLGVVGTGRAGHALARACSADIAPAGTLRSTRVVRRGPRHYCGPLGFPLRRARFRRRLIRAALPRQRLRRRASRVPFVSVHACCAPYPAETCCAYAAGLRHSRLGLRRDMTGSALGL